MRSIGFLLMVSGWLLGFAALILLAGTGERLAFLTAGILVELLGLALLTQHYRALQRTSE